MIFVIIVTKNPIKISNLENGSQMHKKNQHIHVLIVEDEAILALQLKMALQKFGYEVSGIESTAKGAMAHADTHFPDMALLDIRLRGEESGLEAGRYLWQKHRIPIIYLTSYCDNSTLKEAMLSEPYGYLSKPFRDAELKATLHTAWCKHAYFCTGKEEAMRHKKCTIPLLFSYEFDKVQGVLLQDGKAVKLTGNEVRFFQILTEYPGNTVSFEQISTYIWREPYVGPSKLRNLVYRLRQKIHGALLENVFEAGYRLNV